MPRQLLVAVDDSSSRTPTIDFASSLARQDGGAVHVLHVNTRLVGGRGATALSRAEADDVVRDCLEQLVALGVDATGSVATALVTDVARTIAGVAEDRACDAIVLGSRRRRVHWLGQGIRERVTAQSHLPVIAAPAPLRLSGRDRLDDLAVPAATPPSRPAQARS